MSESAMLRIPKSELSDSSSTELSKQETERVRDGRRERLVRGVWFPVVNLKFSEADVAEINQLLQKNAEYRQSNPLGT